MRTISILTTSALAALAVAAPASASAATISPAHVRFPQLAVNAHGATVVAWERLTNRRFAVEARIGGAPLKLGRARRLANQGFAPKVAVGADGTAAVQWMQESSRGDVRSIRVAVARPGHGFGAAQVLDHRTSNMAPLGVAVQPSGRVVAIWRRASDQLEYALASRNHGFGRATDLTATGSLSPGTIALDARDGTLVLAYGTPVSPVVAVNEQAAVRTLTQSATAFSRPTVLSAPAAATQGEARPIAVSGPAGAGVAYTFPSNPFLEVARRGSDGSWTTSERIAIPAYGENVGAREPQATLPADGAAVGAWSIVTESSDPFARPIGSQTAAGVSLPSAPFGTPQAITPAGASFGPPVLASAGDQTFLASAEKHGRVLLATRGAGAAAFQVPVALTTRGDGDVLLAAGGSHVIAAYQQRDRLRLRVVR